MNRDLILLALSMFAWGTGEGMFYIFQPVYLEKQWGASPVQIGAILGAVGMAMSFVQLPSGYLSDRIGPRPVMWAAWCVGLISTLLMGWAGSLGVFFAGMVIYGSTSFVSPALNSYYTVARGSLRLERAMTICPSFYAFGAVVGPLLGGFLGERIGLQDVYRIAAGIFLLSTLIVFFIRDYRFTTAHHEVQSTASASLLKNTRYLVFIGLISLTMFATYLPQPLTSNYLKNEQNLSIAQIGLLGSIGSLSTALVTLSLGSLKAGRAILVGQVFMSLFSLLLWRGTSMFWFGLAYTFLGGYRLIRTMTLAFARPLVRASQTGLAFGLLETTNAVMIILAPLSAGFLYQRQPALIYILSLGLILVSLLVCFTSLPLIQSAQTQPDREQTAP